MRGNKEKESRETDGESGGRKGGDKRMSETALTFIEFCRQMSLSEAEARSCARFLTFIRGEKASLVLSKLIDQEYRRSSKPKQCARRK